MRSERAKPPASLPSEWIADVQNAVLTWGRTHQQDYPWRDEAVPRWQRLIAEFLLLRTRAAQVVPVFESVRRDFPDPQSLATVSERRLEQLMAPLGLYWRVPILAELMKEIAARAGCVPTNVDDLKKLPGVGDYVASAMAALHGGERAVIVDSNIVRLLCRLVGQPHDGETRRKRWLRELADQLTPETEFRKYGYAILDLAMTVCRPRRPLCDSCPLRDRCVFAAGLGKIPVIA